MNTERNKLQYPELQRSSMFIETDDQAMDILLRTEYHNDICKTLFKIARKASEEYSYIAHQTYPRPSHPIAAKRLVPEFTLVSVITSLRCTLEVEQRVTEDLLNITKGDVRALEDLPIEELEAILKPSGIAKNKSIWIRNALNKIKTDDEYKIDGLRSQDATAVREKIMRLAGFGPKAADCFVLLGLDMPTFPVDTNVFKLMARLYPEEITGSSSDIPSFSSQKHVASVKKLIQDGIPQDVKLYQVLHTFLLLAEKYKVAAW
ncbi:MAG: endonuclease III domain-containing protein [Candidatus Saccharibacteria bacterium]|nr:endonuclease III domain-containing protein [Candidatus Saccharibacteria bacterium]